MSHAPFAPSSAKRWITCPGSYALSLLYPDPPDNEYSAEGTRLHAVAAQHLEAPDTRFPVAKDDAAFLKPYLDYALARMADATDYAVEQTINHSQLLFGTPDLLLYFREQDLLEVVDLKCGAGILVNPKENDQALCYAFMTLIRRAQYEMPVPTTVRLTIVQPPDENTPVKTWDTTAEYVMAWGTRALAAIETAMAGAAPLKPGDHCRFCKAKPGCPALRGEVTSALSSLPTTMTVNDLSQWLDIAERLDAWVSGLRELGHSVASDAMVRQVDGIPGWGLKPKRATRKWADEDVVLEIARRRKIKIWQDKLMSPPMAEKEHPKLPAELTEQIVSVSSGMNLVRLKEGEQPMRQIVESEAKSMDKLMANFELLKYRK